MVPTLEPQPSDTEHVLLEKILRLCNQLNGGDVSQPTFYPEGSEPRDSDTINRLLKKIAGSLYVLNETGGSGGTPLNYFSGRAAAKASTVLVDNRIYYVDSSPAGFSGGFFYYDSSSGETADDIDVLDPTSVSGRLIRKT